MYVDLDTLFWELADSGVLTESELVALSRVLDILTLAGVALAGAPAQRQTVTLAYEQLAALWGNEGLSEKSVRKYLDRFREKIPWLGVVYYNKMAVLGIRFDRVPDHAVRGQDRAQIAEDSRKRRDDTEENRKERGNFAEVEGEIAEIPRKLGGDIGGGDCLLAVDYSRDGKNFSRMTAVRNAAVLADLLLGERTSLTGRNSEASKQASNKGAATFAILPRDFRESSAILPLFFLGSAPAGPEFRDSSAEVPRNFRDSSASSPRSKRGRRRVPRKFRDSSAELPPEGEALLPPVMRALDALSPAEGLAEGVVRADIADALSRGVKPEEILAVALLVEAKAKAGKRVTGGLFRTLVASRHPAQQVPRLLLEQAREILGVEENGDVADAEAPEKDESGNGVEVEIVGDPPYDPRAVWEKARERLREDLGRREYNTWLRDAVLVAWDRGVFVIGTPHAFARDWLRNRLDGRIGATLREVAGDEEIEVAYVVRAGNWRHELEVEGQHREG